MNIPARYWLAEVMIMAMAATTIVFLGGCVSTPHNTQALTQPATVTSADDGYRDQADSALVASVSTRIVLVPPAETDPQKLEAMTSERYQQSSQSMMQEIQRYGSLQAELQTRMTDARLLASQAEYARAHQLILSVRDDLETDSMAYNLLQSDRLYRLSGQSEVYGNPYMWAVMNHSSNSQTLGLTPTRTAFLTE